MKIIGLVGSTRVGSYNQSLMQAFIARMPAGVELTIADISQLPFFSEDIEDPYPAAAAQLKAELMTADAFIIATPEYNRGVPGILKNAIDWMSRPKNPSPFFLKPVLVVGASDGNIGTAVAQASLKGSLLHLNAHVLGRPEFYLGMAQDKFDANGNLIDGKTGEFITSAIQTLIQIIEKR
jgi:chromate reductase, NAD(P)H dehydrogenase (quinone)